MKGKIEKVYVCVCLLFVMSSAFILSSMGFKKMDNNFKQADDSNKNEISRTHNWMIEDFDIPENSIAINLPSTIKESDVAIQNVYMDNKIDINIHKTEENKNLSKEYFYDHPIANHSVIKKIEVEENEDQIRLSVFLDSIYEYESDFKIDSDGHNVVALKLSLPKEKYSKIIVLDAGHGGNDNGVETKSVRGADEKTEEKDLKEKDLTLSIVLKAGALIEEQGIKVYYTRQDDSNPDLQQRMDLANNLQADLLISVHADYTEDSTLYGLKTLYNDTFFIPDFGSADFGYLLLEKVAAETNEKALGVIADDGTSYLVKNAMVPVAQLNVGFLSNKQEAKLLKKDDYQNKIAKGILGAVEASYKEMVE